MSIAQNVRQRELRQEFNVPNCDGSHFTPKGVSIRAAVVCYKPEATTWLFRLRRSRLFIDASAFDDPDSVGVSCAFARGISTHVVDGRAPSTERLLLRSKARRTVVISIDMSLLTEWRGASLSPQ